MTYLRSSNIIAENSAKNIKQFIFQINCTNDEEFVLNSTTRLARLQVFNSLAVTAPQIEIDRIRTNMGDDVTSKITLPHICCSC